MSTIRSKESMRPWIAFLGLTVLAILLLGCGVFRHMSSADPSRPAGLEGRELYLAACASCHGAGGRGDGPVADSLKKASPDLTLIAARRGGNFNSTEIRNIVDGRIAVRVHGPREMPIWGQRFWENRRVGAGREAVSRGATHRIVDYLESIQQP